MILLVLMIFKRISTNIGKSWHFKWKDIDSPSFLFHPSLLDIPHLILHYLLDCPLLLVFVDVELMPFLRIGGGGRAHTLIKMKKSNVLSTCVAVFVFSLSFKKKEETVNEITDLPEQLFLDVWLRSMICFIY